MSPRVPHGSREEMVNHFKRVLQKRQVAYRATLPRTDPKSGKTVYPRRPLRSDETAVNTIKLPDGRVVSIIEEPFYHNGDLYYVSTDGKRVLAFGKKRGWREAKIKEWQAP